MTPNDFGGFGRLGGASCKTAKQAGPPQPLYTGSQAAAKAAVVPITTLVKRLGPCPILDFRA